MKMPSKLAVNILCVRLFNVFFVYLSRENLHPCLHGSRVECGVTNLHFAKHSLGCSHMLGLGFMVSR